MNRSFHFPISTSTRPMLLRRAPASSSPVSTYFAPGTFRMIQSIPCTRRENRSTTVESTSTGKSLNSRAKLPSSSAAAGPRFEPKLNSFSMSPT
jgi:hypothetical protein